MTDVPSQPPAPIDVDSPCMRCGYNLRGLRSDGNCPECGNPISASLRGDLLRFSDPKWLAQLRLGASLKLWAIVLAIVVGFAAGLMVAALGLPVIVLQLMILTGSALGLWGTWCITAQEPRVALQEQSLSLRKFIRASSIASAIGGVLVIAGSATPMAGVVLIVGTILGYAGYAATYGELFYFRRFAKRVPDPALVKSTRRMIIVAPIFFVILMVITFAAGVFAGAGPAPVIPPAGGGPTATASGAAATPAATAPFSTGFGVFAGVGMCGAGLFGLFLFLWYIRLLTKYKAKFTEAIAQASSAPTPTTPTGPTTSDQPPPDPPLPT